MRKNRALSLRHSAANRGISSVISLIMISSVLLIILVIASFVSANILELQIENTEFEQAKTNMNLLDSIIQDISLRQGAGGYVQFNERAGGIGINITTQTIAIYAYGNPNPICQWSSLLSIVYHAGIRTSAAATNITGTPKLNVTMSDSASYLRVETGSGVWVKLDYNRLRTVPMGTIVSENSAYDLYSITFIHLQKGDITGTSGVVNIRAQQSPDIKSTSYVYPNGVTITAKLNNGQPKDLVSSPNKPTVIMITEIPIKISVG